MEKIRKSLASQKHLQVKVHVENAQRDFPLKKQYIRNIVREILKYLKVNCKEIGIYFISKKKIASLHQIYFQDPSPTDCISFPIDDHFLGEVFICPKIALEYNQGVSPRNEILLYMIHGILHLIGYDDIDLKERAKMRQMEKKCMDAIKSFL